MKARESKAQYTIEFKQEAIRLVKSGQPAMQFASTLGMPHQTLDNWLRADLQVHCQIRLRLVHIITADYTQHLIT